VIFLQKPQRVEIAVKLLDRLLCECKQVTGSMPGWGPSNGDQSRKAQYVNALTDSEKSLAL